MTGAWIGRKIMERPRRLRRVQLSVPGSSEKMMAKAAASAADHVFLDLEDAVAPSAKVGARGKIVEVLIEEVQALENVEQICKAHPRLECVIFGMGDYSASQGIDIRSIGSQSPYPGDIWHYPRFRMVMAARSAGIDPVDGPYANFRNPEVFREECRRAMILGCVGKWAIHPAQIEPALEIFTPKQEDVDRARKLAAAYAKAEAEGLGAVDVDGLMIDAASIRILNNTLRKAELIGM